MRCSEIMKKEFECISPRDSIEDAACRMRDENLGFLPVCDQSKKVLGTLTDRDIVVRAIASKKPFDTTVEDVMTREVVACKPDDDLDRAHELMARHHKSRIMCCDDNGRLLGVISLSDIAQHDRASRASDTLKQVSAREAHA